MQIVRHYLHIDLYIFLGYGNFAFCFTKSACQVFVQDSDPCNRKRHVHVKTLLITPQLYFRVQKANACCSFMISFSRWMKIEAHCDRSSKYISVGVGVYTFTGR